MLSCSKVDLNVTTDEPEGTSKKTSSNSIALLKKECAEYLQTMTGKIGSSERLASTIEIGKERIVAKIEEDYPSFISKLLLQSLCRLQDTEVLVYVRDSDIQVMKTRVIPWAVEQYKARTGMSVRARIDHYFRLNDFFKGRMVISNADRSLWVDNDVVAKVEDVAKTIYDRRTIKDETTGTLKYMRR